MVLSLKEIKKAIGSIGRRDYRDPTIQRSAKRALERKRKTKTKAPSKSKPSKSAPKVGISIRQRPRKVAKPIKRLLYPKPIKKPLLYKQSVERLIGSIGRRDYRDPEIQRLAKKALMNKSRITRKTPMLKPTPMKRKVKLKQTVGYIKYIDPTIQKVTTMKRRGKIMLSKKGVEKAIGSIGRRDYKDPIIQKLAKEAWMKKRAKILQG